MSQENVEVVRRSIESINRRDLSQFYELCDADIEVDLSRNIFNPDVYRGYSGVERWLRVIEDVWDDFESVPTELIDAGDKVVVAQVIRGKGKESGVQVDMKLYSVSTLRDSKIVHVVGGYRDRSEALEAAGLRE